MTQRDEQLQEALDAIENGQSLKSVLAEMDRSTRADLEPLLRIALHARALSHPSRPSPGAVSRPWYRFLRKHIAAIILWGVMGGLLLVTAMIMLPLPTSQPLDDPPDSVPEVASSLNYETLTPVATRFFGDVRHIAWSGSGDYIVAVTPYEVIFYTHNLRDVARWQMPATDKPAEPVSISYENNHVFIATRRQGIYQTSPDTPLQKFADIRDPSVIADDASGQFVAAIDGDKNLYIWQQADGQLITQQPVSEFTRTPYPVTQLIFSDTGDRLAMATRDSALVLWSVERSGLSLQWSRETDAAVEDMTFASDELSGETLVVSYDNEVTQHALQSDTRTSIATTPSRIRHIEPISESGNWLLQTMSELYSYNPAIGDTRSVVFPPAYTETAQITFAPDGRRFATMERQGDLHVWTTTSDSAVAQIASTTPATGAVRRIAISPQRMAAVHTRRGIWLLDLESSERTLLPRTTGDPHAADMAFSPTGHTLALITGSEDSDNTRLLFYDVSTDTPNLLAQLTFSPSARPQNLAWHPDGHTLVTGGSDVRFWDMSGETPTRINPVMRVNDDFSVTDTRQVRWLGYTPSGEVFIAVNQNGQPGTWDTQTGEQLFEGSTRIDSPYRVTVSAQHLIAARPEDSLGVWDVHTGELVEELAYEESILSLAAVPEYGHLLISTAPQANTDSNLYWHTLSDSGQLDQATPIDNFQAGRIVKSRAMFALYNEHRVALYQIPGNDSP